MSHLTEEQFEDILQGHGGIPEHVDECPECRTRLEEKRALARRLHDAFTSVHVQAGLADRVRARIAVGQSPSPTQAGRRITSLGAHRRIWSGLAVAAAILLVAIPRSLHFSTGPQATAAQTALASIHFANLQSLEGAMIDEDSGKHCQCMAGKLEGGMTMPCCQRGLCLCGCQMRDFQGRLVESCVIQEPNGPPISVIAVPESPQALGMSPASRTTAAGQAIWQGSCGPCNMASVRMGEGSCCVIGQVPYESLVSVLNTLEE
jgi:hypothetical protein